MRVLLILISLLSFGLVADNKPNDFILYCKSEVTSQEAIYKYSKSNELFRSWVKRNNYFEPEYDDYILLIHTTKLVFVSEDKLIFSDAYNHIYDFWVDRKKLEVNNDSCSLVTDEEANKHIKRFKQEQKEWRLKYPKEEIKNKI